MHNFIGFVLFMLGFCGWLIELNRKKIGEGHDQNGAITRLMCVLKWFCDQNTYKSPTLSSFFL